MQIPLSRGRFALIDDADWDAVSRWKWYANEVNPGVFYARHNKLGYLHRFLIPGGPTVDHINGNTLDCQRHNLRAATYSENCRNRHGKFKTAFAPASQFPGVTFRKERNRGKRWRAHLTLHGKHISCGYYHTELEAVAARRAKERELFGVFAPSHAHV